MNKDKLYIYTLSLLIIIVLIISVWNTRFVLKISIDKIEEQQLENSEREAREIANLLWIRLQDGVEKEKVAEGLQLTIENSASNGNFICMYNQQGIEICHPDPLKIGQVINNQNSIVKDLKANTNDRSLLALLQSGNEGGGIREFASNETASEIIYVHPVKGTDWMVASHAKMMAYNKQINQLKFKIILLNVVASLFLIIVLFVTVRLLGNNYEKYMEKKNEILINEVVSLTKLNQNLVEQKIFIKEHQLAGESEKEKDSEKGEILNSSRILVSWRDQLIPIQIEQIAYFYTEYSMTKIVCLDKCMHSINLSLDEIAMRLNKHEFFRANRQYLVSLKAISTIYKYGNNQLKIDITPKPITDIIISKHKVSEFKKWLNY